MSKPSNEQPSKRVKVTLACSICRKKKVKCDGIQPTCSRCSSIGITCQYTDHPKKRGPPKGYVEVIENRAHRIESLLIKSPTTVSGEKMLGHHDTYFFLVDQQNIQHHKQYVNAIFCLVADAVEAFLKQENDLYLHGSNGILYGFLMDNNNNAQNANTWIDSFFDYFNHLFPILSRPQFMIELEKNELNSLLKLAVYLLGCRLNNDPKKLGDEISLYQQFNYLFNSSHDVVIPDLILVQTMVIMCWYSYLAGDIQKCHSYRVCLSKRIQKLSMLNQDIYDTEMHRRAYWVSFVIDQWLSYCLGGERFVPLNMDMKYPQLEDNQLFALQYSQYQDKNLYQTCFSLESALQIIVFHEMIKLSKIMNDMFQGVSSVQLESNLTGWLLQLPSYLDYSHCPSPISKIYRILYYTVQIMLNKRQQNHLSSSICTTAANTIIHIAEKMKSENQENYVYNVFFTSVTLATSIHLDNTVFNNSNSPDKINLCKSISLLKEISSSLLEKSEFSQLLNHFLVDKCQIMLEEPIFNINNKRILTDNQPQQQLPQQLNLNDLLFPMLNEPQLNNQWSNWVIDFLDSNTIETDTTYSPPSESTPSQSPSLSLNLKDEDISSQQLFSFTTVL